MEFYLDETFKPNTEIGKKLKQMVENGEHCDGNIYWLIEKVEELTKDNRTLNMEIGSYAAQWQDLVSKMDDITKQMKLLTNSMYLPK